MRWRFLLGLALSTTGASVGYPQDARAALRVAPAKLYTEMIRMAGRGEWDNLGRAVELLDPFIAEIDADVIGMPGRALRVQIAAQASSAIMDQLARFALAGATVSLRRTRTVASIRERRDLIKVAFTEYLAVTALLPADRFQLQREIQHAFRTSHALAGMSTDRFVSGIDQLAALLMQAAKLPVSGR